MTDIVTADDLAAAQHKRAGTLAAPPPQSSRYVSWYRQSASPCPTCAEAGRVTYSVHFNTRTCSLCTIAEGTGPRPAPYDTAKVQRRTPAEIRNVVALGRKLKREASATHSHKLSAADVETIAEMVANGTRISAAAKQYGVSSHTVELRLNKRIAA